MNQHTPFRTCLKAHLMTWDGNWKCETSIVRFRQRDTDQKIATKRHRVTTRHRPWDTDCETLNLCLWYFCARIIMKDSSVVTASNVVCINKMQPIIFRTTKNYPRNLLDTLSPRNARARASILSTRTIRASFTGNLTAERQKCFFCVKRKIPS